MGKDTVIAVIERRGEVIYYKTTKMSFFENKKKELGLVHIAKKIYFIIRSCGKNQCQKEKNKERK